MEYNISVRTYGEGMARKIAQRINELHSADNIEMLIQYSIGRCHSLKGNRNNEYVMDLVHPFRLVFKKIDDALQLVKIIAIEDYH